jgi:hypothetical protein
LDLVLTAPFDLDRPIEVGPPVAVPLGVGITDSSGGARQPPLLRTAVNGSGAPTRPEQVPAGDARSKTRPKKQRPTRSNPERS